jgi:hypothetical protein
MCFRVLVSTSTSRVCWLFLYLTISFLLNLVYILLSGILTCRLVLKFYVLSLLFKKNLGFVYLEFIFLDVLVFCFSRVNYVDMCLTFLIVF